MDLNEIVDIANGKKYDREKVSSRRVNGDSLNEYVNASSLENLDEMVFGGIQGTGAKQYSAEDELKLLKTGINEKNASASRLPDFIKNDILENPLIMESVDPQMDDFTANLEKSLPGIQHSLGILEKLDKKDNENTQKRVMESKSAKTTESVGIDYGYIKYIVEQVINEKLSNMDSLLTESVRNTGPGLKVMNLGKKFLFLDDEDNIYECQMVYKGKNKKRKK